MKMKSYDVLQQELHSSKQALISAQGSLAEAEQKAMQVRGGYTGRKVVFSSNFATSMIFDGASTARGRYISPAVCGPAAASVHKVVCMTLKCHELNAGVEHRTAI